MACGILKFLLILECPFSVDISFPVQISEEVYSGNPVVLDVKIESDRGGARGVIFINSSPEKVWEIVRDAKSFPEFMPDLKSVEIEEKKEDYELTRFYIDKIIKFSYRTVRHFDRDNYIVWWEARDENFEKMDGYWKVVPQKEGVLLFYYVWLKPRFFIPSFIVDYLQKKSLRNVLFAVKERVEGKRKQEKYMDIPF